MQLGGDWITLHDFPSSPTLSLFRLENSLCPVPNMEFRDVWERDCRGCKWYVSNQENSYSAEYRDLFSDRSLSLPFLGIVAGWGNLGAGKCVFTVQEGSYIQISDGVLLFVKL